MVELTHGGTWFKWDSLGPRDRKLTVISLLASFLAAFPMGFIVGAWAHRVGYRVGSSGDQPPSNPITVFIASDAFKWVVAGSLICALISAIAWWRFSINQDELFNRIQNYAIAQGASWTLAAAFVSWMLALGGWVEPLPLGGVVIIGVLLICGFWFQAVRRWA